MVKGIYNVLKQTRKRITKGSFWSNSSGIAGEDKIGLRIHVIIPDGSISASKSMLSF